MNSSMDSAPAKTAQQALQEDFLQRYGPVLGGQDLQRALGFTSAAAFRQAALRGTLPIKVFQLPNRRGRFAITQEVTSWLWAARQGGSLPDSDATASRADPLS